MSREDEEGSGLVALLAGLGVGIVLGGLTALLLAPQSGAQTRARIRETADETVHRLRDSLDELKAKVDEVRHSLAHKGGSRAGETEEGIATNA